MDCQQCKAHLDPKMLDAQQGSSMLCPSCGEVTKVKYTAGDSLADPVGSFFFRDTKYIHPAFMVIALIFMLPLLLYMLFQNDMPELRWIGVLILSVCAFTGGKVLKRMNKTNKEIEQSHSGDCR